MSVKKIRPMYLVLGIGLLIVLLWGVSAVFGLRSKQNTCIAPPVSVVFPPAAGAPPGYQQTPVPVASVWEPQLSQRQRKTMMGQAITSLVARSSDDIWMIVYGTAIVNYRPSTGQLVTYTVEVGENEFVPRRLFLAQDSTLWGIGMAYNIPGHKEWFTGFLSRYDATEDRFVTVMDDEKILVSNDPWSFETVADDSQGNLWFAVNSTLIRYDPTSEQAERINTQDWGLVFTYFTIAADDTLWLSAAPQIAPDPKTYRVYHYDPRTGTLQDYGTPPGAHADKYAHNFNLAFDRAGRLWASDFG